MKIGITYRLFLAILTATFLAVVCMFLIMQWSIDRGFLRYVNSLEEKRIARLVERLEESYAGHKNWDFLVHDHSLWRRFVAESMPEGETGPPGWDRHDMQGERPHEIEAGPPGWNRHDMPGVRPPGEEGAEVPHDRMPPPPMYGGMPVILLDADKKPLFGSGEVPVHMKLQPIHYKKQVVGYLGLLTRKNLADIRRLQFVKEQRLALSLVAAVLVLLTAGLSLPLANRLIRPIRALVSATRQLTAGQYATRVPVTSADELGQLARDFNALALALEKNEQARRQWVADISHELRTPLAVLRGEVEALQDGIRQPTPESIRSLHGEVMRLSRLVDDLYQLSLSDLGALTYRKENIDLTGMLNEVLDLYRPEFARKGITLTEEISGKWRAMVFGDPERLRQLFANLLDNALKYTDKEGELAVRLECCGDQSTVDLQDSAPGVPLNELEKLFERLYRVETSRTRAAGGAGLGLAICRNIVEAHAGTIAAQPSPLGGVWIRVTLPLVENCR
jgi:two-component system sensor histidine kinase BaeS